VELHGTVGPARTTMTAVAERAGVQRQTVYRHFADEEELLAACSAHFAARHPWPDAGRWRAIADPAERLRVGLDELYAWYEVTGSMWTRVLRDETLVAALGPTLAPLRAYLDDAAHALAAGWGVRGRRRAMLLAATRHAVDFHTWRSLAHDGGVSRAGVVELTSAMVGRAASRRE
jgi:AcrR family transcriptional regulator